MKHKGILSVGLLFSSQLMAFPCFLTLVKDSCWTDYNVTVNVIDSDTSATVMSLTIPKGTSWGRQKFECQPSQKIKYTATFTPVIWESETNRVYDAIRYWQLPSAPQAGQKAWELPICFTSAFAEVPLPPNVSGNCQCDFSVVTPIPLQPK